jgi:hypothetical protein
MLIDISGEGAGTDQIRRVRGAHQSSDEADIGALHAPDK